MTKRKNTVDLKLPKVTLWCAPKLGHALSRHHLGMSSYLITCDVDYKLRTGAVSRKLYMREINKEVWVLTGFVHQVQSTLGPVVETWYGANMAQKKRRQILLQLRDMAKDGNPYLYIHNKKLHSVDGMEPIELFRKMGLTKKRNHRFQQHHGLYFEQKAA